MRKEILLTKEEIEDVFNKTNFGPTPYEHIVKFSLLKIASGYSTGYTAQCCLLELGLVNPACKTLTKRGKYCLWEYFQKGYKDY